MEEILRLILDVIILGALGIMIFYAMRLASSLSQFRRYKGEFERIMRDVSVDIDKAQKSLESLKGPALDAANDLQLKIQKANDLADELRLMNQTAEHLAQRLENSASGASAQVKEAAPAAKGRGDAPAAMSKPTESKAPAFAIHDRDFEEPASPSPQAGKSRAEQELMDALLRHKKS